MTTPDQHITEETLSSALDSRFVQYAFMSLEDRALPDARDGLKPSQRRVLITMFDLKLTSNSATEKSAKITGYCSGNYHPHGDMVVYPTMYRMVQPWILRYPLLTGQGNFGNPDGDSPAAQRYTEAKFSKFGEAMLQDLSPDVVPFIPNYNEKLKEPTILPSLLPNLLVNGCEGIAVGWATKILPHNLREVAKLIKAYVENNNLTAEEAIKIMPGPDFPTGGKLLGKEGVLEYYKTGRGKIILEGNYEIQKDAKSTKIVITELPYQTSPDDFYKEIEALTDDGKIVGISDAKNLSSRRTGIQIVLEVSKSGNPSLIVNQLIKHTCLRKSYSVNQTVLIDGKVVPEASLLDLVKAFVEHRKVIITNKYEAELKKSKARINILDGLIKATKNIDRIIKIVRESDSPEEAETVLIDEMIVTNSLQAQAVLAITLRQLTKLEANKLMAERDELIKRITWLENVLKNASEVLKIVIEEQEEIAKKLGDDRRTKVIKAAEDIEDEDLIQDEQLIIALTGDGYLKSVPVGLYRVQNRGGTGSLGVNKNDDPENIFELFESGSKKVILFFSNLGTVYQRKAYEIPQSSKTGKGLHVSNLLNLEVDEQITNMIALDSLQEKGNLVIVTKLGMIKKTPIAEYDTNRKNTGIVGINLKEGDNVQFACITDGKKDIFIATADGQCVRYNEAIVPEQGRATQGCRCMKLDGDDSVAQVFVLDPKDQPDILVVTSGGFGKKTAGDEYKSMNNRAVKGYSVIKKQTLIKNGKIVGACAISKGDGILVMVSTGKCLRLDAKDIRETGRTTAGVKLIKLDNSEMVVKITKVKQAPVEI
jgi:DNA gyrase subunit A